MKIILAPDSFKGSLSSLQAAEAMARGIRRADPHAEIILLPLADGGEGTLDALLASAGGQRVVLPVLGPCREAINAEYGLLAPDSATAVVEMASAAGLALVPEERRDPRQTTTYGVGELILAASRSGAHRLIVGLGGSGTNDGGAGAMQALGARFYDTHGALMPSGIGAAQLNAVARIDVSQFAFPLGQVSVIIASDVTSPLLGPNGASAVYGPQKGASPAIVAELDDALAHYAALIARDLGQDIALRPGAGAAGGLGAALMAFLGAQMQSGIDLVLDAAGFDAKARGADWVFTGEGRIDAQTLQGKTIAGVLARCRALDNLPVVAFGGSVEGDAAAVLAGQGLTAAFPIAPGPVTLAEAIAQANLLLEQAAERVTRLLRVGQTFAEPPS